ncbi:MAG: hypothetical protein JHC95_19615 [Solirubrobacteraceae bacterium]|nr:hypothetical protein [Solirubrobacteraceae bacterium]
MRLVLLAAAVVVSLWPAAAIVFAVDRVVLGGEDSAEKTAAVPPPNPGPKKKRQVAEAQAAGLETSTTTAEADADLIGLNELRDETRNLLAALSESSAASGIPDSALAADAVDLEAALSAWRRVNRGRNADAEAFARLFAGIAASAADFAAAPTATNRVRLDAAIERHRRETFQSG